jgi:hypothetical protein
MEIGANLPKQENLVIVLVTNYLLVGFSMGSKNSTKTATEFVNQEEENP